MPEIAQREFMSPQEIRSTPEGGSRMEELYVPHDGWKKWVRLRYWTNKERDEYEGKSVKIENRKGRQRPEMKYDYLRARAVALSLCSEKGKRLFSDHDVEMIGAKEAAPIDFIFAKVQEMNGLRKEDLEELEKNSGATQDESPPCDSPPSTAA